VSELPAFVEALPALNACLNAASATCVLVGWAAIRRRRIDVHWRAMVAALACSAIFLASYLTRFAIAGTKPYAGPPELRALYLGILFSHMTLAIVIVPLVLRTVYLAARKRFAEHVRIVRFTLPIWLYVSVTGIVVYVMLYRL
jgi:putative membrane protein